MITLADIFGRFWSAYLTRFRHALSGAQRRAAEAILRCRTERAGMVYYRCGGCGKVEPHPVSCGNRACNACGQHKSREWEARQKSRLLPVPYHMVTFTVPSEFRALFRRHQELCYNLFFRESSGALRDLAADPRHLGGELGMTGVLQTWTRDLRYHPHIHYLVPGGALTQNGNWIRPKNSKILVPAKPLAVRMRNRFRQALKAADFKLYQSLPHKVWRNPWNADARETGYGGTAFQYVARYVQKTAIDASRIAAVDARGVTFRWTERKTGTDRRTTLSGDEFLRRFLQHVLPPGFMRVRHFGWLSAAAKVKYDRLRALLRAGAVVLILPEKPAVVCSCCGGTLTFMHALRQRARPPPTNQPGTIPDTLPT